MKRGKKVLSVFQIQLLIVSIFAFCFILNMSFVGAEGNPLLGEYGLTETSKTSASTTPTQGYINKGLTALKIDVTSGWGYGVSGILKGAWYGALAAGVVKMLGGFFGVDEGVTNAAAAAVGWGIFAGQATSSLFVGNSAVFANALSATWVPVIGFAVAIIAFIALYKDIEIEVVEVECLPWDSATGGSYCERCNNEILPCSEYQCRSLGQGCQLVNPGTEDAKCVYVNKNDVEFPTIQPWGEVLSEGYRYTPDNAISPPDRGVIIEKTGSSDKCVDTFTPLSFGITLDEPGRCKMDYLRKDSFEEMNDFFFSSGLKLYNHTYVLPSLPGPNSEENLTLKNGGNFEIYVRCEDANGNSNVANFVFKFCVSDGPDTTAPLIVSTKILNNVPIAAGQTELAQEIYVNEPSECRWDYLDRDYKDMENQMECSTRVYEMNAQMLYTCKTTLNGIKDNSNNKFYFRCKDQPTKPEDERNTNTESYEYTVIGTRPLVISDVGPNDETIKDSTGVIKVTLEAETSAGYDDGNAICYYSTTGEDRDYVAFLYEEPFSEYSHSQVLGLAEGSYQYYIKCVDLGGNADTQIINFNVETDSSPPLVVRAFHDGSNLKIITDEDATCVYDTKNCLYNFEDGLAMTSDGNEHTTGWNTNIDFYIKCQDEYGKEPNPNVCSIIVRPSEI